MRSAGLNKASPGKPIPGLVCTHLFPGSLLFAAGLFWYGWSSMPDVHWIVPAIGITLAGVGIYSIYMAVVNYLTDACE